jgi:epoxyqueuosine reductase
MSKFSVLVHCCCAHCSAYTIEYWRKEGYDVSALWYNPNVHPFREHQSRLEAMNTLSGNMSFPLVIADGYEIFEYFRRVTGNEVERCTYCFTLRLDKTAEMASKMGIGAFTSSLLISPHQKHDLARSIGEKIASQRSVRFLYADLRKRYSDSRHVTKPMELYRQKYCGCLYSEWEGYSKSSVSKNFSI